MSQTSKRGLQAGAATVVLGVAVVGAFAFRTQPHLTPRTHAGMSAASVSKAELIEAYLRRHANDPASVQIQSVSYDRPSRQAPGSTQHPACQDGDLLQMVRVQFREKNTFGAITFRDILVTIRNDCDVIHGSWEQRLVPIVRTSDWSSDPSGPR